VVTRFTRPLEGQGYSTFKSLELVKQRLPLSPDEQFARKFRNHEEGAPAPTLFGAQHIAVDVVSDVEDVFSPALENAREFATRAARVDVAGKEGPPVHAQLLFARQLQMSSSGRGKTRSAAGTYVIYLPIHRPFCEPKGLHRIDVYKVEVTHPAAAARFQEVFHDFLQNYKRFRGACSS